MTGPHHLGSQAFRDDYGLRYAYVAGAMVKGIASEALVARVARTGALAFYGAGGVRMEKVEAAVREIRTLLPDGEAFGVNLLAHHGAPEAESDFVNLLLRLDVRNIEASAYIQVTPALVKFRLSGARSGPRGAVAQHRIMGKLSRPEVARQFLAPAPQAMVAQLLQEGQLTAEEAACAAQLPLASDICVEADSGGHTDMGAMAVLLPSILRLRDAAQAQHRFDAPTRVGAGGGVGAPEQAAAAFLMGADFIVTGSINQCTVEAGTSEAVKTMLQSVSVQDTAYAPAGDMFEMGAKIQVLKKGVFFPARAGRLHDLWRLHDGLDALDAATRREIQEKYFRRSFEEVWRETQDHYLRVAPAEIERAERNPKAKMALVFRWYFIHSMRLALEGAPDRRVDYQVHCGPALGAFNQWVADTPLADWRNRHADTLATMLMQGAADYINQRLRAFA
ncbi:MAG: PfaD family polyunsaturated fatty acid/polyketide biosynthesis protein [Alphaproteobacteria bacterium]|nr:PfaD family polyunsaturated fatty acid/polyketide biosynthesis protein [Alphaproteobacteria bacterium]MBM3653591.1 PfaD family polyunsaturated fatty acid/polyketide biosynthesis protein [Alphaproteobacteria bacterium]